MLFLTEVTKYLTRTCPRCGDFFGVILSKPSRAEGASVIKGECVRCGFQIDWMLLPGRDAAHKKPGTLKGVPTKDLN